jgi:hypothetical protein
MYPWITRPLRLELLRCATIAQGEWFPNSIKGTMVIGLDNAAIVAPLHGDIIGGRGLRLGLPLAGPHGSQESPGHARQPPAPDRNLDEPDPSMDSMTDTDTEDPRASPEC